MIPFQQKEWHGSPGTSPSVMTFHVSMPHLPLGHMPGRAHTVLSYPLVHIDRAFLLLPTMSFGISVAYKRNYRLKLRGDVQGESRLLIQTALNSTPSTADGSELLVCFFSFSLSLYLSLR